MSASAAASAGTWISSMYFIRASLQGILLHHQDGAHLDGAPRRCWDLRCPDSRFGVVPAVENVEADELLWTCRERALGGFGPAVADLHRLSGRRRLERIAALEDAGAVCLLEHRAVGCVLLVRVRSASGGCFALVLP